MAAEPISKKSATDVTEDIYEEPRFLCCCQRMHIRTAAMVIAVLASLLVIGLVPINLVLGILVLIVSVVITSIFFWAIHTNNAVLILIYLVWQIILSLILAAFFLFALITASRNIVETSQKRYKVVKLLTDDLEPGETTPVDDPGKEIIERADELVFYDIVGFLVLAAYVALFLGLNIWWTFLIHRFYEYLKIHGAAGNAAAKAEAKVEAREVAKVSARRSASAAAKVSGTDAGQG